MLAQLECLPCLVRQAVEMARMSEIGPEVQIRLLREVMSLMSRTDLDRSPPEIMGEIGTLFQRVTGIRDPYSSIKRSHTETALGMIGEMDSMIRGSEDPFVTGLKLAAAGNIIDLGARSRVDRGEIAAVLREAAELPVSGIHPHVLKRRAESAARILYLADNAGETVFDRKFIELLPPGSTTVAVRGGPALNDATMEDAVHAGLDLVAELVENGSNAPATVLDDCSADFTRLFEEADLIIAKGQGNYESLSGRTSRVHFLFRVKCGLVADHSGYSMGSLVLDGPPEEEFL